MAQQVDDQVGHGVRGEEMCIGEVTEEDMLHKLLEHEEDSGGVVCSWKGEQESALERR